MNNGIYGIFKIKILEFSGILSIRAILREIRPIYGVSYDIFGDKQAGA